MSDRGVIIISVDESRYLETLRTLEGLRVASYRSGPFIVIDEFEDTVRNFERDTAAIAQLISREIAEPKPVHEKAWFRRFEKRPRR